VREHDSDGFDPPSGYDHDESRGDRSLGQAWERDLAVGDELAPAVA